MSLTPALVAFLGPALVVLGAGALLAAGFAAGALDAGGAEDPLPAPAPAFALAAGISSGMSSTSPGWGTNTHTEKSPRAAPSIRGSIVTTMLLLLHPQHRIDSTPWLTGCSTLRLCTCRTTAGRPRDHTKANREQRWRPVHCPCTVWPATKCTRTYEGNEEEDRVGRWGLVLIRTWAAPLQRA